jgi:anti-sigma factor RsiW
MFLSDYIDGTIPLAQSRTFDSHTARCPNCRTFLANYQRIISALLASNPGEIPSLCREPPLRVIEAIRLAIGPRS